MKNVEVKKACYELFDGSYSVKKFAVPEVCGNFSHQDIPDEGYQDHWKPFRFKKLKEDGPLPDYAATDICGRLCSPKLRSIVEENLTEADNEIQWLPMLIEDEETGKMNTYYYLHFPEVCDTLDLNLSRFSKTLGGVEKIVFSYEKVINRSIFNCDKRSIALAISKRLKEALFKSGCTGMKVEDATVVRVIDECGVNKQ